MYYEYLYTIPEGSGPFCVRVMFDNVIVYGVCTGGATFFGDTLAPITTTLLDSVTKTLCLQIRTYQNQLAGRYYR